MPSIDIELSTNSEDQLMIMNILSATLYTDKVSAVLREYGCNAADANVEAGRGDVPIEVTLPTRLSPNVVIRDFGDGMTLDQVRGTFSKPGSSTKRHSNEITGMMGIGSKVGFAYGDSFLVTSYTRGTKAVYNCYRENGALKIAIMHSARSCCYLICPPCRPWGWRTTGLW
jgi:HSP90 family molecular chaperone